MPCKTFELINDSYIFFPRYLGAAQAGDVLELKAECIKKGKKLVFATLDVTRKSDGKLIAVGRHTKYVG